MSDSQARQSVHQAFDQTGEHGRAVLGRDNGSFQPIAGIRNDTLLFFLVDGLHELDGAFREMRHLSNWERLRPQSIAQLIDQLGDQSP